eukprot:c28205_g1_i1 orf=292-477(+)
MKPILCKGGQACMLYVRSLPKIDLEDLDANQQQVLEQYEYLFMDELPDEFPPSHPKDHKIE